MKLTIPLVTMLMSLRVIGATWYLDNAATGTGAGTSWDNAFTNSSQITAAVIAPGDIIYVSGGTTSKTYTNTLVSVEAGTAANPIIFRNGQTNGHNGVAIFPAFNFDVYPYVILDGARTSSYSPPASALDYSWTNNIGFRTTRTNATGMYMNGAAGIGNRASYVEIGPIGTTNNIGDIHGVYINNLNSVSNLVFEYMWIHDIQNDGINFNSVTANPDAFDRIIVRNCLIETTGDDGVQSVRNGFTLYRSTLRGHWYPLYNGHPDQLQLSGLSSRYLKVVNNFIGDKANSLIIGEHYVDEGATIGPMLIAGNIFANHRDWIWNNIQAYGATFAAWRANGSTNVSSTSVLSATLDGFHALNNTIYYQSTTPFGVGRAVPTDETDTNGTRSVWILNITNSSVRNNLEIDSRYNSATPGAFNLGGNGAPGSGTNGVYYTTNDYPATHNIITGPNNSMSYNGTSATNAAFHGLNNGTNMPSIETNSYTFVLSSTDTVAKDQGYSLSALTNTYPELMTDLYGNARGQGAGWDIGATETPAGIITNGLVLRISFDDTPADIDDGYDDTSGYGHHALHFGYGNAHTSSNRRPDQIVWTNLISSQVHTGATFYRYVDGWDEYNATGSYLGITNRTAGKLWNMPQATIMFFARYRAFTTDPLQSGYTNFTAGANRRLLGAGYGYGGAWTIGLMGNSFTEFRVYTNDNANADAYIRFSDKLNSSTSGNLGDSTNMVHYSVTWSNGLCMTYVNGVPFRTNQFLDGGIGGGAFLTNLTIRGTAGSTNAGFLMIGGDTHNGNPWLVTPAGVGDDGDGTFFEVTGVKQIPNHGFLGEAVMDDVRIYDRVLGTNELYQIASNTETGGGVSGGGGGGGGGSSTNSNGLQRFRANTARIGRIIRAQ